MRGFKILVDRVVDEDAPHTHPADEDCGDVTCVAGHHAEAWRDGTLMPEGKVVEFRLYDDDDNLYYEGVYGEPEEDTELEIQYSAVLNFGEYWAGCTYVMVKRDGDWVQEIG